MLTNYRLVGLTSSLLNSDLTPALRDIERCTHCSYFWNTSRAMDYILSFQQLHAQRD